MRYGFARQSFKSHISKAQDIRCPIYKLEVCFRIAHRGLPAKRQSDSPRLVECMGAPRSPAGSKNNPASTQQSAPKSPGMPSGNRPLKSDCTRVHHHLGPASGGHRRSVESLESPQRRRPKRDFRPRRLPSTNSNFGEAPEPGSFSLTFPPLSARNSRTPVFRRCA